MKLVIFSGTTEGRELSYLLAGRGIDVTVCIATEYGREEQGFCENITVLTGRKDQAEMAELLKGMDLCIDATHPYAVEATKNIRAACEEANIPCRRLLRQSGGDAGDGFFVNSAAEAAELLKSREGNILLTTGAKELAAYRELDPARLYPRVLPTHSSLTACEEIEVPHRNILAMQGPFSLELNEAMIRQFHIDYLVTKDGGRAGGFEEKVLAAEHTGIQLVVIRRPEETGETFEALVRSCEEWMK